MSPYFPEPSWRSHPSNCAKKSDLKEAAGTDTSALGSKTALTSLKTKVDKIDADQLKTDLIKLSNVVDSDFVKKTAYDKKVTKVKAIENKIRSTSGLVNKTQYNGTSTVLRRGLMGAQEY